MDVKLCEYCVYPEREQTVEEKLEHINGLLIDTALLQALIIVHGRERGLTRYFESGALLHVDEDHPTFGERIKELKQDA